MQLLEKISSRVTFAFTACVLILSLIAFASINGSLAWLASNKEVSASGMQIKIKNTVDIEASVKIHGVTDIEQVEGVDTNYIFDPDSEKHDLPKHDPNGISYDRYHKALVLHFEITAGDEDVSVIVDIEASGGVTTANDNFISNAVSFTKATVASGTSVAVKDTEVYSFVTVSGNNVSKEYTLSPVSSVSPINITAGSTVSFYMIIEYNEPFIEYINAYMLNNSIANTTVNYSNDLKFVIDVV